MTEGQKGYAYGRKASLIKIRDNRSIRVLFLEGTDRCNLLEIPFVPFEDNVPMDAWGRRRGE
jgi:hypothetical protein